MVMRAFGATEVPPEAVCRDAALASPSHKAFCWLNPEGIPWVMGTWRCSKQPPAPCDKKHKRKGQARPLGAIRLTFTGPCPLKNRGVNDTFLILLRKLRSLTCILVQRGYLSNLFFFPHDRYLVYLPAYPLSDSFCLNGISPVSKIAPELHSDLKISICFSTLILNEGWH